ncbi:hypothetical protein [Sphingobium subterraneum]|uniref:Uncharacterized protein n=1 Tax=Sphingobium subterraneum TaxID=627688 RepID=A0A841J0L6_9SPHN|nr:hypothetical protein [Sphingobium subterraneum]MBB6124170.1 hypothetical protein [Sphingobium subterraneum]
MTSRLFSLGIALTGLVAMASPARAQDAESAERPAPGQERVVQVIVYGDDPCKAGSDDEIVVCVRQAESERYRIPENLRGTDPNLSTNQAWTNRVKSIEYVGRNGTQSCSPVGGGGFTGCFSQIAAQAKAERQQQDNVSWADLVAAERAKRLSVIDSDSKAIEERVKAEEAAKAKADAQAGTSTKP